MVDKSTRKDNYPFLNPDQTFLLLYIRDSGCGMEEHIRQRIFEPYFTTKGKGEGTGLGLSVVHGIVQSYGGHISVKSKPGKGTWFKIFLPCLETALPETAETEPEPPTGSERVLVVDDEPMLVEIEARLLEHLGYAVTTATSSEEALQLFKQAPQNYDLLITDLTMPGLTGVELASRVLQCRHNMPIIICTGYNSSLTPWEAKDLGIEDMIIKPVHPSTLASIVRKVLDRVPETHMHQEHSHDDAESPLLHVSRRLPHTTRECRLASHHPKENPSG